MYTLEGSARFDERILMISHPSRSFRREADRPREEQLAYKRDMLAVDRVPVDDDVSDMIITRTIDNAAAAMASAAREPVVAARAQAVDHPFSPGASVFGIDKL